MAFFVGEATYKVETASWDSNAKQYDLYLNGRKYNTCSSLKQAKAWVGQFKETERRVKKAIKRIR
jgi:hypothetical protein